MEQKSIFSSKIIVSGASGLIGTSLVRSWMAERIQVLRLIRGIGDGPGPGDAPGNSALASGTVQWNPSAPAPIGDLTALQGGDAAVHLSGASVAGHRWTAAYKREIVSSRVQSTNALVNILTRLNPLPKVLVCASAIGIYGDRGDELLTEESPPGTGFLAETCVAWEAAAKASEDAGIRVVHARFGVVLAPNGGALAKMLPLFRFGLGGKLGNGREWMPWITLRDVVGVVNYCLQNDQIRGPVNAVAPNPVTNEQFTRALAAAVRRPAILPAPAFALRLAFGEMAEQALLASARVVPEKLERSGFHFADPEIGPALRMVLAR
jgi:uncharacterized protein (TIGR01777 family)